MRITVNGTPVEVNHIPGDNLYELLTKSGYRINAPCGGGGRCGKCRVTIENPDEPTEEDARLLDEATLEMGIRLACATVVSEGMSVGFELQNEKLAHIVTEGKSIQYAFNPAIREYRVKLSPPELSSQSADFERVKATIGMGNLIIGRRLLKELPFVLRANGWEIDVVTYGDRLLGFNPHGLYGVAVDIGTTTLATYLMDLRTGAELAVASSLNPQKPYGDDVISRSDYARSGGLDVLQQIVAAEINRLVVELCAQANINSRDIYLMTLAGNTVMMHLFAGVSPENIALSPFIPAWTGSMDFCAAELGLELNPEAVATVLPCVAGYVGADTVAAMLAAGVREDGDTTLLIDIGTNGEIALSASGRLFACSTAAGPAFEGAHISSGMGGVSGAINKAKVDSQVRYSTIGNTQAKGICGSGLLDLISGFLENGAIDDTGRIDPDSAPDWLQISDSGLPVDSDKGIFITKRDIREVQLAKGAIAAGVEVLINEAGIKVSDIQHVYLAGGFGSFMDKRSACRVGLIPMELLNRTSAIGNGSGAGAKAALLSCDAMREAERLSHVVRYVELSARKDFQDAFMDKMMF